jgi:glycosyltransferase involved in cell wall biosynthesis
VRILIFIDSLHGGGAEAVARVWVDGLRDDGHDVSVATFVGEEPRGENDAKFRSSRRLARWIFLPIWFRRVVRRRRPDIVFSMLTFSNLIAIAATRCMRRPPIIISERNLPSLFLRRGRLGWRLQAHAARLLYGRADGVVALSHPVAADLVSWFRVPASIIAVVPNPIIGEAIATASKQERSGDKPADAGLRLVFVGRLVDQKHPELLLRALSELVLRGRRASLTVFGTGPLLGGLQTLAAQLGVDVEWRGWVEEWAFATAASSCLVLPSRVEGFGNVLVEAAFHGLPVVTLSSALGVADAVIPGVTGVLAHDDTPEAIASAIERAAEMTIPVDALAGWWEHFSVSNSTRALTNVFRETIERQ